MLGPPNWSIRNCGSTLKDVGRNCTGYGKFWVDDREGINSKEAFHQNTAPAITFRQQADSWIASLPSRKRRPIKPAAISGWRDALNAWLLPHLGKKLLAESLQ